MQGFTPIRAVFLSNKKRNLHLHGHFGEYSSEYSTCLGKKQKTVKLTLGLCQSFQKGSSQTEQIDSEATESCFRAKSFS